MDGERRLFGGDGRGFQQVEPEHQGKEQSLHETSVCLSTPHSAPCSGDPIKQSMSRIAVAVSHSSWTVEPEVGVDYHSHYNCRPSGEIRVAGSDTWQGMAFGLSEGHSHRTNGMLHDE
jgi:hypothetical protein